jgi:transaldolase
MICSIAPKIADMLRAQRPALEERIDAPIPAGVLERLLGMAEFRKAYEPDGMAPDDFLTYGSSNRTLAQFCDCGWSPLEAYTF